MKNILFILGILIGTLIVIIGIHIVFNILSYKLYNNGIHNNCGGHWIYQEAVGHKYHTGYIYSCDKCGLSIEITNKY